MVSSMVGMKAVSMGYLMVVLLGMMLVVMLVETMGLMSVV